MSEITMKTEEFRMKVEHLAQMLIENERKEIVSGLLEFSEDFLRKIDWKELPADVRGECSEEEHRRICAVIAMFALRFADAVRQKPHHSVHVCLTLDEVEEQKRAHANGSCPHEKAN